MSERAGWIGSEDGLTPREAEVLSLCAEGLSNQEIADALFLNIETVKSHLKRAYGRLGLRNRAEAAAYVHRRQELVPFAPLSGPREAAPRLPLALQLGLDGPVMAERLALMGLSAISRTPLTDAAEVVAAHAGAYAQRLLARWTSFPPTAPYLANDAVAARLADHQARYLNSLFSSDLGEAHIDMVLSIGATHHRLQLSPQWHLASYAHLIGEHLPILFERANGVRCFLDAVDVLVRSVLFDTSVMLDAYEMYVAQEILDEQAAQGTVRIDDERGGEAEPGALRQRRQFGAISKLGGDPTEAAVRLEFIGLDPVRRAEIRRIAPTLEAAIPAMVATFYELVSETPSIASLVDAEGLSRLMEQTAAYWTELLRADVDRMYVASRLRVGMVHERIGLTPQLYVAGLAHQLASLLRSLEGLDESPLAAVDALLRAVLFDLTFVIDAYVEARAAALVRTDRFADQVIAGLSTGVAIVDVRNRIEVANQQLLHLVGLSASVAHRMPVADALPLDGIVELVDAVRLSGGERRSSVVPFGDKTLQITVLDLHQSSGGRAGLVGIVVDDITAIIRMGADMAREERRFLEVLSAVGAVCWELDRDSLVIVAISAGAASLLGRSEVDLLGRTVFADLVADDDRAAFVRRCRELGESQSAQFEHGLSVAGRDVVQMRSTVAATRDRFDTPTISGVSIVVADTVDHGMADRPA